MSHYHPFSPGGFAPAPPSRAKLYRKQLVRLLKGYGDVGVAANTVKVIQTGCITNGDIECDDATLNATLPDLNATVGNATDDGDDGDTASDDLPYCARKATVRGRSMLSCVCMRACA